MWQADRANHSVHETQTYPGSDSALMGRLKWAWLRIFRYCPCPYTTPASSGGQAQHATQVTSAATCPCGASGTAFFTRTGKEMTEAGGWVGEGGRGFGDRGLHLAIEATVGSMAENSSLYRSLGAHNFVATRPRVAQSSFVA